MNWLSWLMPKMYFQAEGDGDPGSGGGGGDNDDVKALKAEIADLKSKSDETQRELEETQAGLLDPEYLEWKDQQRKGGGKKGKQDDDDTPADDDDRGGKKTKVIDPYEGLSDEQLANMDARKLGAHLLQAVGKQLGDIVPAITKSLKEQVVPSVTSSIKKEQEAKEDAKVKAELTALKKDGKDWTKFKNEMYVLGELHPDWSVKKAYTEAVKLRSALAASEGRELTAEEKKAMADSEPEKPSSGGEHQSDKKDFKSDAEAAEDAYEATLGKT